MTDPQHPISRPALRDLGGLWRRSLLVSADGVHDDATRVAWLQGARCYVDLRQPISTISYDGVRALRDLDPRQVETLAAQEGFAGVLVERDGVFEWTRQIDYQPKAPRPDRGTLDDLGDVMIERGCDAAYVEHWHRVEGTRFPLAALSLRDHATACRGMIVRSGDRFMVARDRRHSLSVSAPLVDYVRAAGSLDEAQDIIDCELSLGRICTGWRIERSSLPFRIGRDLAPRFDGAWLKTTDVTPVGQPMERIWSVVDREGDLFEGLETTDVFCGAV